MINPNQARLNDLICRDYADLAEAQAACVEAKALAQPDSRTARYLIVTAGGNPGTFRLVTNGDIGEKSLEVYPCCGAQTFADHRDNVEVGKCTAQALRSARHDSVRMGHLT
jgi:hypothetical protein